MSQPQLPDDLWREDQMIVPLHAVERPAALRELAERLRAHPQVRDPEELRHGLERREVETSTYLGRGVALPHARVDGVASIAVAVGTSAAGIPWGAAGEPAHLVIAVGVPREAVTTYLAFVSRLTKQLRRPGWAGEIARAGDRRALATALEAAFRG